MLFVPLFFQNGCLWVWSSWGLSSSSSWLESAGASVALIAAAAMFVVPAAQIPAAVRGHVSDCLQY